MTKNKLSFKITKANKNDLKIQKQMQLQSKTLQKGQMELVIEVSSEELKPYLEQAVLILSSKIKIPGFRPGKVPYEIFKKQIGEMKIYEKAAELAIEKTCPKIIKEENLETVGPPQISITKLAPDNPLIFTATVALVPRVKLTNYRKIKVEKKKIEVEEKQIEGALKDLQKMQIKEKLVRRPANRKDKIMVDIDISINKIPLEGGQAKNHSIYLNDEPYYIAGLTDQLIGASENEVREFSLPFPKNHFQKNLAGQNADFKVKIISVFELEIPPLDDDFAKTLGQNSLYDLKNLIRQNLMQELSAKEDERQEIEILNKIVKESRFDDIPETLLNSEVHKMIHELENGLAEKGLDFQTYLGNIKKTRHDLMLDFAPRALERIKTALAIREVGSTEKITASEQEIEKEKETLLKIYHDDQEMTAKIREGKWNEYLGNVIRNRKSIKLLKELATK